MATSARLDELKKKFDESPRRYFAPLANELRKLGDLAQAIAICRAHLPNQPGHISGHIVLGQALFEARELGESRQLFESALDLDPENLIALRFLGDIAREQGDTEVARGWYYRVLEADPRNEEIHSLLLALPALPSSVVAETAPAADFASLPTPPTVASVGTFDLHAELALPHPAQWSASETGLDAPDTPREFLAIESGQTDPDAQAIDVGELATGELHFDAADVHAAFEATPAPALTWGDPLSIERVPSTLASDHATEGEIQAAEHPGNFAELDILDLDEATAAHTPERAEVSDEASSLDRSLPAMWTQESDPATLDLSSDESAGAVVSGSDAARSSEGAGPGDASADEWFSAPLRSEIAARHQPGDIARSEPELPDDDDDLAWTSPVLENVSHDPHAPPASEEGVLIADVAPAQPAAPADAVAGAREEQQVSVATPRPVAHFDRVSMHMVGALDPSEPVGAMDDVSASRDSRSSEPYDSPQVHEETVVASDTRIGVALSSGHVADAEPAASAFVTETMAELYLRQGFTEEALAIYRQLAARSPGDEALQQRLRAVESVASGDGATLGITPQVDAEGQSARAFFAAFARREPTSIGGERSGEVPFADAGASVGSLPPSWGSVDRIAGDGPRQSALDVSRLAGADDALSTLFPEAEVAPSDEAAAEALAGAFAAFPPPSADRGTVAVAEPASSADRELSLPHLFGDVPPRPSGTESLDEFLAGGPQPGASTEPGPDQPPGPEDADIEHFTAWLEGLKKK